LLTLAAAMPAQDYKVVQISPVSAHMHLKHRGRGRHKGRAGREGREAKLAISMQAVTLLAPKQMRPAQPPLPVWIIRVWEPEPPPDAQGKEQQPIEWVLVTSVPTDTVEEAWERRDWYSQRWVVEDYHQCLKSGCALEERHLHSGERLMRLVGLLSPVAVRLLQLRELARSAPDQLAKATGILPMELVGVVAALADVPVEELTMGRLWEEVARQGGWLGRKGDGPPGWQTLWRGWEYIQSLLEGVRLAAKLQLPIPPQPG
jgi:hypothetical protein